MAASVPPSGEKVRPGEESLTVFVSNLSFDTTLEQVKDAFSDSCRIAQGRLVADFKGRSKGFGYITFESPNDVSLALKKDRTQVGNRPMFVSRYEPNKAGHKFKYSTSLEKDKLFVKGLPFSLSEKQVKEFFEAHAPVQEIRLATYRNGYSKGICFVKFADAETAEKVRKATDQIEVKGSVISVLISDPSQAKKAADAANPKNPGISNITDRKATLSLVPRSVAKAKPAMARKVPENTTNNTNAPKSNDDFRKMLG